MLIAEIGQNFCGDIILAKQLIEAARENGADLAKFQLYDTDALYPPDSPFKGQAKEAELSFAQAQHLFNYGQEAGIEVFFSVFDTERVKWCEQIGVKRYKIAYSQRDNGELLKALEGKDVIISLPDSALTFLYYGYLKEYKALYCVPEYPARKVKRVPFEPSIIGRFHGFSDHTIGLDAAKIALSRGAQIIEKHFAVAHNVGVDGAWSMTPSDLKELKRWEDVVKYYG